MKTYKFEITLTEEQLAGDEFWEDAIKKDITGISETHLVLKEAIDEAFQLSYCNDGIDMNDIVTLKDYKDI